ncbi:MAG: UGSC family (seleno)protein, partial [Nitrospinota bacterium]
MAGRPLSELSPGVEALLEAAIEGELGDGLPIVPPTREAVRRMLQASPWPADRVLGVMAPALQEVTVEEAALCAVAAGCRPDYFPVVAAALEAIMEPEFNLLAIQATTELASPLVIVNDPAAARLGIHGGSGCLGPGFRANATIGRAVRLAAMRLGGAIPGEMDMATFGHAGKFTACFAEAEGESPWEPLHVERGFGAGQSTVTAVGADAPVNVNDFA